MNWRLASRFSVITLAFLVVLLVAVLGTRSHIGGLNPGVATANQSSLQGTDLDGVQAPNFRLTDQLGRPISLSQFKGKPVVLTFLYTHCPDQCPLTAEKLHAAMLSLGSVAQQVAVLAVSTDPRGDTTAAALNFSKVHKMLNYWHYLLGTQGQLAPVWSSYTVYAAPTPSASGGSVSHTTAVFVIDKQGRERVFLGDDFTSAQLVGDLQTLLKEEPDP